MKKSKFIMALSASMLTASLIVSCNPPKADQYFTVSFDTTDCTTQFNSQKVKKGEKAVDPGNATPKAEGKVCKGWNYNGSLFDFSTPIEKDMVLTANIVDATFTVTFNTAGCVETYQPQTVKKGEKAANPGNPTPLDQSKQCNGWNYKNVPFDFNTPIESDITLTPAFTTKTFTVRFDTNGFKEKYDNQIVEINKKAKNPGFPIPSDESLRCYGWNLDGKYFDFENTPITKDITLKPATTSYLLDIEGTKNVDIESASPITYIAKKEGVTLSSDVEWYTYNNVVQIDKNSGTLTIPSDCKGGVDYIVAKYTYAQQDYYGALAISVASFNKLDSTNLNNHIACKADTNIAGKVIIPNIIFDANDKEIKINNLGQDAFSGCSKITKVISLGEYKTVPDGAFKGCTLLESLEIGENVESIGDEAFRNCVSLDEVIIPKSVNKIGEYAFAGTALSKATFENPDGWIYSNVNPYPVSIDILKKPDYAGYLLSYYFNNATWIRKADVEKPLVNFNDITLEYNDSYKTTARLFSNQNVTYKTDTPHVLEVDDEGLVTPKGIGTGYANVRVNNGKGETLCGVNLIGDKYIVLHDDNENIYATSKAKEEATCITLPETYKKNDTTYNVKGIVNRGFYETRKLNYIYIPDFIETIGDEAFAYELNVIPETSLSDVLFSIESKCTSIGKSCFRNCAELTSINLPINLTNLGEGAFEKCTSLTSVTIGDKLSKIQDNTFKNCSKLRGLFIPKNITALGDCIFESCTSLRYVYYEGTKAEYNTITKTANTFKDTPNLTVIHCIDGDVDK